MIMNIESKRIMNIMEGLRPGAWYCMDYYSDAKQTKKAAEMGLEIVKISHTVSRFALDYLHLKSSKEKILKGEISGAALPWGVWEVYKYIISHTNKKGEYNEYLRFYLKKSKAVYYVNGVETSKQKLLEDGLIKENKSEFSETLCVNTKNIISINHIIIW